MIGYLRAAAITIAAAIAFHSVAVFGAGMSADQAQASRDLSNVLAEYRSRYSMSRNDFDVPALARERNAKLEKITENCCRGWEAYVLEVSKNADGSATLAVAFDRFFYLQSAQAIDPTSPMFTEITKFKKGMHVRFNGRLIFHGREDTDSFLTHTIDFEFDTIDRIVDAPPKIYGADFPDTRYNMARP